MIKKLIIISTIFISFVLSPYARRSPFRNLHNKIYSLLDFFQEKKSKTEYNLEIPRLSTPIEPEKNPKMVKSLDYMKEISKEEDEQKELDKRKFVK